MVLGRPRVAFVLAAAVVGSLICQGRARCANDEEDAIHHGLELRRLGKDKDALDEFQKAYAIGRSARALAQIGLAEQALGRWVDAEAHVTEALSNANQPWIRKNGAIVRSALEEIQRHIGSLEVMGPPGAEARINGQVVGALPFERPVRVPIGTLNVELRKQGFLPATRPVTIAAGTLTRESIDLSPAGSTPRQAAAGARPSAYVDMKAAARSPGNDDSTTEPDDDQVATHTEETGGGWHRGFAWGTAIVAVIAAAGGATALLLRNQKLKDIDGIHCNLMDNGTVNPPDPNNTGRCLDLANSSSTLGVASVVSLSIAGAFAITSVVLFATMPSSPWSSASVLPTRESSLFACGPLLSTPGAVCQLSF